MAKTIRPRSGRRNVLDHTMPTDAELKKMFDAIPILDRHRVHDRVLTAGAKPVVTRARQLTPRGNGEDRNKRSQSQKASANWDIPLHTTIARVIRKYSKFGMAIIGPKWPDGNKAYFNTSPKGRTQWFWGKPTGRTVPMVSNWIKQAFDETRPQQLAAMKAKLRQVMDEIWK